jgi:hypothetical protein
MGCLQDMYEKLETIKLKHVVTLWRVCAFLAVLLGCATILTANQVLYTVFHHVSSMVCGSACVLIWWIRCGSKLGKQKAKAVNTTKIEV